MARDVVLVLGCALAPDGSPSAYLADRLKTTAELVAADGARKVLASGGPEASAMGRFLVELGVPAKDVVVDPHGVRTFDSLWRARHVYGLSRVVVVTHAYHLRRALFIGRRLGMDADGVAAREVRTAHVRRRTIWKNEAREVVARGRALLDVYVLHARAHVEGPPSAALDDV